MASLTHILLILSSLGAAAPATPDWVPTVRQTHANFTGQTGTLACLGDSITVTLAFWTPLLYERKNASPEMEKAFALVKKRLAPPCWRDWKGPQFGNEGTRTSQWAVERIDDWLKRLNPETAVILFGTNDLTQVPAGTYEKNMRRLVQRCLDNGTVPILTTIPPRHGLAPKAAQYADIVRAIAADMKIPLIDYHAEILRRRPTDWDGADAQFSAYQGYDVPTLLSRDGVHPSNPKDFQDYSDASLSRCGFALRNFMTLMTCADVLQEFGERTKSPPSDTPSPKSTSAGRPLAASQNSPAAPDAPTSAPAGLRQLLALPWLAHAPALPPAPASAIAVSTSDQLRSALASARPGQTILVADGYYQIDRYLEIRADNVTLRSASGHRAKVVLDGGGSLGELLGLRACSGVTIADLTVQNVKWNGIKINSETGVHRLTIRNCVLHNVWQRAVKGVMVPQNDRDRLRPSGCTIEFCLFYNDRPKTFADDEADRADNFRGNYVGGIDAMCVTGWTIRDNVFYGIRGRTGEARGAVFLWVDSRDCLIQRNVIVDCDSGICLGNSYRHPGTAVHATGMTVRNNFLARVPENGLLADYTRDCRIVHNTVFDPASRMGRLIRVVHDAQGLVVANNLLAGPGPSIETDARITLRGNVVLPKVDPAPGRFFADSALGDLHLSASASPALGQASPDFAVPDDIDRQPRKPPADAGADQH